MSRDLLTRKDGTPPPGPDEGEYVVLRFRGHGSLEVSRMTAARVIRRMTAWWGRWGWMTVENFDGALTTFRVADLTGCHESTRSIRRRCREREQVAAQEWKADVPRSWDEP